MSRGEMIPRCSCGEQPSAVVAPDSYSYSTIYTVVCVCGNRVTAKSSKEAVEKWVELIRPKVAEKKANAQIENNFRYHPPRDDQQIETYQRLRDAGKEMALLVDELCPQGREKSLAMTKIEEAIMWANASVAREGTDE